jgi:DNA polymerase III subunit delta'
MIEPTLAPWLQRQLNELRQQRGHALLLVGPSGLGQYELALALARSWLCETPTERGACGQCGSCHAVNVHTHPDLCMLMPETLSLELGWPLDEVSQKKIDEKDRKASKIIKVEAARQAVTFTQFTRSRGNTKVVLVYPAESMNMESANTLLKTLEEPVGAVRFVLATEVAHQLLPTVRSRCLTHHLQWPSEEEALPWLMSQANTPMSAEQARVVWRAAGGRPDDALRWAAMGLSAQTWSQLPKALAQGQAQAMSDWEPAVQLEVMQKVCHDLMAVASGAAPRFFETDHLPAKAHLFRLQRWSQELMQAARSVEHPVNAGLRWEAWMSQAQQALSARR